VGRGGLDKKVKRKEAKEKKNIRKNIRKKKRKGGGEMRTKKRKRGKIMNKKREEKNGKQQRAVYVGFEPVSSCFYFWNPLTCLFFRRINRCNHPWLAWKS
jgi:hypothetical protein